MQAISQKLYRIGSIQSCIEATPATNENLKNLGNIYHCYGYKMILVVCGDIIFYIKW